MKQWQHRAARHNLSPQTLPVQSNHLRRAANKGQKQEAAGIVSLCRRNAAVPGGDPFKDWSNNSRVAATCQHICFWAVSDTMQNHSESAQVQGSQKAWRPPRNPPEAAKCAWAASNGRVISQSQISRTPAAERSSEHTARPGPAQPHTQTHLSSTVFMTALSFILNSQWSILFLQKHCIVQMPVH